MIDDPNYDRDEHAREVRHSAKLAAVQAIREHGPMPITTLARLVGVPAKTMGHVVMESYATFTMPNGRTASQRQVRLHRHLEVA